MQVVLAIVGPILIYLLPRQDHVGRWLPHPDTVPLLEHYVEWCRRTGRHPKIEPVNARGF